MDLPHRPDVDGLRGIAIGAVVLFHLFPESVVGGFVGVDVFFVISGFLITRQIHHGLQSGRFTFQDFYERRARRLMPALIVVLLASLLAGFDVLLRIEWEQLARHALGGVSWTTNFVLWGEGGYFDRPAHFKPLHHLWSLGVEEQFYLVWPALLVVSRRWAPRARLAAFAALGVASFALSLVLTLQSPPAAFYLPFGRLWQFACGALASVLVTPRAPRAGALALGGAVLTGAGVAFANAEGYPGLMALLPTVGAFLLIVGTPGSRPLLAVLSWRPLVWLGLISYPLYLWHWPVEVYARLTSGPVYWGLDDSPTLPPLTTLGVLALSVTLSVLTWRYVERPIRFERKVRVRWLVAACVGLAGLAGLAWSGAVPPRSDGVAMERLQAARTQAWTPRSMPQFTWEGQSFAGTAGARVLFIGDSNMGQYAPAIDARLARGSARTVALVTQGGCPPFVALDLRQCQAYFEAMRTLAEQPSVDTIVIAAQWALYFDNERFKLGGARLELGSARTEQALSDFGAWLVRLRATRRVVLVLNIPTSPALDPALRSWRHGVVIETTPLPRDELERGRAAITARLLQLARTANLEVIDPFDTLCGPTTCARLMPDGSPIYRDGAHVSGAWAGEHFHAFDPLIDL